MTSASIAVPTRRIGGVVQGEMTEAGRPLTFGEAMATTPTRRSARRRAGAEGAG